MSEIIQPRTSICIMNLPAVAYQHIYRLYIPSVSCGILSLHDRNCTNVCVVVRLSRSIRKTIRGAHTVCVLVYSLPVYPRNPACLYPVNTQFVPCNCRLSFLIINSARLSDCLYCSANIFKTPRLRLEIGTATTHIQIKVKKTGEHHNKRI